MPSKKGKFSEREIKELLEKNPQLQATEKKTSPNKKVFLSALDIEQKPNKSGRAAHSTTKRNKTELEYEIGYLSQQFDEVHAEKILIPIGDRCTYRPDFFCIGKQGMKFSEVKGSFFEDDAIVKCKIASRFIYPIELEIAKKIKKEWKISIQKATPLPFYKNNYNLNFPDSLQLQMIVPNPKDEKKNKVRTLLTSKSYIDNKNLVLETTKEYLEKDFKKVKLKEESFDYKKELSLWRAFLNSKKIKIICK